MPALRHDAFAQGVLGRVAVILRDAVIDKGDFTDPRFSASTRLCDFGLDRADVDVILVEIEMEFGIDTADVDERAIHRVSDLTDIINNRLMGRAA